MTELIEQTFDFIRQRANAARKPAAMISFGKDSMAMAWLIREALLSKQGLNGQHFPLTHLFPIPVIYHRDPWFAVKHKFAEEQIRAWAMEVHDFPPLCAGVKTNDKMLELVARYPLGTSAIDLPKNVCAPEEYPRRDYICGLRDWIGRTCASLSNYPWDLIFMGHKDSDVDLFEGAVPLKDFTAQVGGVTLAFPFKNWTEENIWDYIASNRIPVQPTRYQHRQETADRWQNNDYIHACVKCIDPRVKEQTVFCPKLKRDVPNVGPHVLQLHAQPYYIEKGEH